jgi:alpha-tubulin suppressor-like RCC1 family protein
LEILVSIHTIAEEVLPAITGLSASTLSEEVELKAQANLIFISITVIILTACKIAQTPATPTLLPSSTVTLTHTQTQTIIPSATPTLPPIAKDSPTPNVTQELPSKLPSTNPAISISAGYSHVCALLANGEVLCWGNNSSGQLGDGTYSSSSIPVKVIGLVDVVAIAAGGEHTCAITKTASIRCWGDNYYGQLGDGTTTMKNTPVDVIGLSDPVISLTAGQEHTCAITNAGQATCWGNNHFSRLGTGSSSLINKSPENVIQLRDLPVYLSAGDRHTCALLEGGGVQCWGDNTVGQLGITENIPVSKTPLDVVNLESGVTAISTGYDTSCAILSNGKGKCWGRIGTSLLDATIGVIEFRNAVSIAAGFAHFCVVTQQGVIYCRGWNSAGQLGDGTTSPGLWLVKVTALDEEAVSVVASGESTCALMKSGSVKCWGDNNYGQLGDGTEVSSALPVAVLGLFQ